MSRTAKDPDPKPTPTTPAWTESSTVMSGVAHDARTPLSSILMMAELLADDPRGTLSAKQLGYAEKIQGAAHEVRQLLTTMSLYGKLRARRIEPQPTRVALEAVVERTLQTVMAERADDETPPTVSWTTPPGEVALDVERFSLALGQLVAAAQEVSPGSVRLHLEQLPEGLRCRVRDTGPEVSAADLEELFTPFASGTRRWQKSGGHSLRLPLAHALADWAGGRLEALPESEGLTLQLVWPVEPERVQGS